MTTPNFKIPPPPLPPVRPDGLTEREWAIYRDAASHHQPWLQEVWKKIRGYWNQVFVPGCGIEYDTTGKISAKHDDTTIKCTTAAGLYVDKSAIQNLDLMVHQATFDADPIIDPNAGSLDWASIWGMRVVDNNASYGAHFAHADAWLKSETHAVHDAFFVPKEMDPNVPGVVYFSFFVNAMPGAVTVDISYEFRITRDGATIGATETVNGTISVPLTGYAASTRVRANLGAILSSHVLPGDYVSGCFSRGSDAYADSITPIGVEWTGTRKTAA